MNIALARYRYSPHGGAERYLDGLLQGLASQGARVTLLTASWEGAASGAVSVETIRVPAKPAPLRLLLFAGKVRSWSHRHPDWLLFSLERIPGAEVYRAGDGCHVEWIRRKRSLRPLAWPVEWLRPLNRTYLAMERAMFRSPRLRAVVANSALGKEDIVRHFGFPGERVAVVHNGVDASRFPPELRPSARRALRERFGIRDEETVFLFVGSGFARKGVGALVDASVRLARRGASFRVILVGKGNAGPYRRAARRGGAEGKLHFPGPIPGARDFFLGADAFVFPTVYEPFSNACLEAMAAGLPVVTTAVNGASEVLRDGESGYVIDDPLDVDALAERMERLLSPERREAMGAEARRAAETLTLDRNVSETLAVLSRAWAEKSAGGGMFSQGGRT
ncbi:MAG: glycosyltransferase family 4 protein [Verrucomicrobiota bacterium]